MKGSLICTTLTLYLGFFDVEGLYHGTAADRKEKCETLGAFHRSDVDGQQLYVHIMDCRMLLSGRANMKISRSEEILELIVQYEDEDVFPNIRIAIQIILTIASCERFN